MWPGESSIRNGLLFIAVPKHSIPHPLGIVDETSNISGCVEVEVMFTHCVRFVLVGNCDVESGIFPITTLRLSATISTDVDDSNNGRLSSPIPPSSWIIADTTVLRLQLLEIII